jgi:hypothetical protein
MHYHQALEDMERIGDRHGAAGQYFNLGNLYRKQGDQKQAHLHFQRAKALFEMVGDAQHAHLAAQVLKGL